MHSPDPERFGILKLLDHGSHLETPIFQRTFAWKQPQIDDFWDDLIRALDAEPTDQYFLGLIVLDGADEIQDGQQRLATTLILASELYEQIESAKKDGAYSSQLAKDALAGVAAALRQDDSGPLRISDQDQDELLNRAGIRSDPPESAKRLAAARKRLAEHLERDLEPRATPDSRLSRLKQWAAFLREKAYVVVLRVPTKDAHNIFETLNTRGVRLSNGDLTKSHLISRATEPSLAIDKWGKVTDALKDPKGRYEEDLESFLLHYYGSRYGRTTKAELFTDYRAEIEDKDALATLDELIESAKLYRALVAPAESSAIWSKVGDDTQQAIELLNALRLKQLRYLLLAVLRDLVKKKPSKTERRKQRQAILKITAWSVRALVDNRTGGSKAERTYIEAALQIRSGALDTVAQLKRHFLDHEMLPLDDKHFERGFREYAFDRPTSSTSARAVLYALEHQQVARKSALKPRDTLSVEHVLPKSPAAGQWQEFSVEDRTTFTFKLGNLLLIDEPSGANDDLANKEWPEKKKLIRAWLPQTPLTEKALNRREWKQKTIDDRTGELAKLAVKTWAA